MNTRFHIPSMIVVLLALIASACQPISPDRMDASLPQTGEQAAASPVEAPPGVAIVPFGSKASAHTNTVARMYSQPDTGSQVVAWVNPGLHFSILGFSADGNLIAISSDENSYRVAGWISAADLIYQAAETHSLSVTKVYQQPSSSSPVVLILTPDKTVGLLGTSPDNAWSAVVKGKNLLGWVQTTELKVGKPTVEMNSLVQAHRTADENSATADILTPGVRYTALGRSQDVAWIAVASQKNFQFAGWVRASEIKTDAILMNLPILSNR